MWLFVLLVSNSYGYFEQVMSIWKPMELSRATGISPVPQEFVQSDKKKGTGYFF
jgi:hypothetical protein